MGWPLEAVSATLPAPEAERSPLRWRREVAWRLVASVELLLRRQSTMIFRTAAVAMMSVSTVAQAQTEAAALAAVEVIGSRVPRIDGETALPVQVIRREEIERSGVATVEELLTLVSANYGGTPEASSTAISGV